MDQLVHAPRAKRGPHDVDDGLAGVDIGNQLRFALRRVGALLEEHNLRLQHATGPHTALRTEWGALHSSFRLSATGAAVEAEARHEIGGTGTGRGCPVRLRWGSTIMVVEELSCVGAVVRRIGDGAGGFAAVAPSQSHRPCDGCSGGLFYNPSIPTVPTWYRYRYWYTVSQPLRQFICLR